MRGICRNGISIGGGGATIIGGGESAQSAASQLTSGGDEKLILCNDGAIDIWTNCQSGAANATKKQIDTSGNFTGNAANVTGTVAIGHGGTGATTVAGARNALGLGNTNGAVPIANGGTGTTTRLGALKALTNENVGTNAKYFLTITDSWAKGGFTSVENAKSVLGIGSIVTLFSGTISASTDYTLSSSRKFSDYYLMIVCSEGYNNVYSQSIPVAYFTSTNGKAWWLYNGLESGNYVVSMNYISDTKFHIGTKGWAISNMRIYGLSK